MIIPCLYDVGVTACVHGFSERCRVKFSCIHKTSFKGFDRDNVLLSAHIMQSGFTMFSGSEKLLLFINKKGRLLLFGEHINNIYYSYLINPITNSDVQE